MGGLWGLSNFLLDPLGPPRTLQCDSIYWDIAFRYLPILQAVHVSTLPAKQVSFDVYDIKFSYSF
jgi:hypothetical protein